MPSLRANGVHLAAELHIELAAAEDDRATESHEWIRIRIAVRNHRARDRRRAVVPTRDLRGWRWLRRRRRRGGLLRGRGFWKNGICRWRWNRGDDDIRRRLWLGRIGCRLNQRRRGRERCHRNRIGFQIGWFHRLRGGRHRRGGRGFHRRGASITDVRHQALRSSLSAVAGLPAIEIRLVLVGFARFLWMLTRRFVRGDSRSGGFAEVEHLRIDADDQLRRGLRCCGGRDAGKG